MPNPDRADPKYLYYWLRANRAYLNGLGNGATFKELSRTVLDRVQVPLPPVDRQRQIAGFLDRADDLQAKRREALALLEGLTQSIFLDMFGEPRVNHRCWPRVSFADACRRVTVGVVVRPASHYVADGIPALRSLNIAPMRLRLDDLVHFSPESNDGVLRKSRLRTGDLVIVRTGQPGASAVVPPELDGANAIDVIIATPDSNRVKSEFLASQMNTTAMRSLLLKEERGQIQQHLNVGSLNRAPILLPPMDRQEEFVDRLRRVQSVMSSSSSGLSEANTLSVSLQHRAFAGEL